MEIFQQLVDLLVNQFGIAGLIASAIILLGVYLAKRAGLVANGDHARIANVVLGAVLQGLGDNPLAESALMAVLSSVLAGLAFELLGKVPALKKFYN